MLPLIKLTVVYYMHTRVTAGGVEKEALLD